MSYRNDIDDKLLVSMYADSTNRISDLESHFNACGRTLRRHLRSEGVVPSRKVSQPWNIDDEWKLYDAKQRGLTGAELQSAVPARTLAGIKAHAAMMAIRGVNIR